MHSSTSGTVDTTGLATTYAIAAGTVKMVISPKEHLSEDKSVVFAGGSSSGSNSRELHKETSVPRHTLPPTKDFGGLCN